jgi:hypothetical protein
VFYRGVPVTPEHVIESVKSDETLFSADVRCAPRLSGLAPYRGFQGERSEGTDYSAHPLIMPHSGRSVKHIRGARVKHKIFQKYTPPVCATTGVPDPDAPNRTAGLLPPFKGLLPSEVVDRAAGTSQTTRRRTLDARPPTKINNPFLNLGTLSP